MRPAASNRFMNAALQRKCFVLTENLFHEAEDYLDNGIEVETLNNVRKGGRNHDEADVEVILNPGPMIAPDIIIRQFVDNKMTVDKMMEEMMSGVNSRFKEHNNALDAEDFSDSPIYSDPVESHFPQEGENEFFDNVDVDKFSGAEENTIPVTNEQEKVSSDLKAFSGSGPCRMKFNGTSGKFFLNFTQDCLVLVTTPEKKSTVVLNCSPVALANCTTSRDTITVNLKGDMRFGRNSYVYCGSNAQIRATSLRRRISIKIRKSREQFHSQIAECSFHTRKRRDISSTFEVDQQGVPSLADCGRLGRAAKIVGGRRVSPGLFPWVAQLDITRTDGTQTACTGSLISPHYVLTAAHCLKNAESISVFLGGTDRHEFTGSEVIVQAEKYILHRKWSPRTLTADIALVKLTDPVKFTEDVSPICLPKGKLKEERFEGKKGVAVGWGRVESKTKAPRVLYRVRLPFLDEFTCQRHYRRFFVPRLMLCTDSTTDSAICYGDSGGPLMYKRQDRVYQVGVASFSLSKTCGASPDVFTDARHYIGWIESRIKGAFEE